MSSDSNHRKPENRGNEGSTPETAPSADFGTTDFEPPESYAHLLAPEDKMCWWCRTRPATTGEHKYKRSSLTRLMDDKQMLVWRDGQQRREIRGKSGIKRDRYGVIKFPKSLCAPCNNDLSQPFDIAYDIYAKHVETHIMRIMPVVDMGSIYKSDWQEKSLDLARYYAKHFGCRMSMEHIPIPQSLRDFMNGAQDMDDGQMVIISTDSVHREYGRGMHISPTTAVMDRERTRFIGCVMASYIGSMGIRYEWVADGIPSDQRSQFFHYQHPTINFFRNNEDMIFQKTRKPGRFARFVEWLSKP